MKNIRHPTVEKYIKILTNKNYSKRSIEVYSHYLECFILNLNKNPYKLNKSDLEKYLLDYSYSSISQQNQIISSLKLYYKYILNVKIFKINGIERPRKQKKLPRIINHEHILNSLNKINNIKHKAILSLSYSTGMRVSEIINLKISDIDSYQMLILIRDSKFNKDRYVKLTPKILDLLRKYYKEYKPYIYMFNGQNKLKYTSSSCNKIVKKYLGEEYHMHLIRHSYASKCMENGTHQRLLQNQMGHNSSKTLEIYTHVSSNYIQQSKTPI